MRSPTSGSMSAMPEYHSYETRVEFAPNRTRFDHTQIESLSASMMDVGKERRVSYSIASNGTTMVWAWTPATHMQSALADKAPLNDRSIRFGTETDTLSLSETTLGGFSVGYGTRLDLTTSHLAFVNGNNLLVYQISGSTLSLVNTVAHAVPVLDGLSVSIVSQNDIWLGWVDGNTHYCKRWTGSWSPTFHFSAHKTLEPWHATGFRVAKLGNQTVIVGQKRAGAPVARLFSNNILSEPFDILGADSEYAFQWAMVTGLNIIDNKLFAAVSRAPENSYGELTSYFSNMVYSRDGMRWTDWCGIDAGDFRGGVVTLGNSVIAGTNGSIYESSGTDITGNATWETLNTAVNWNYSFAIDRAGMGNTSILGTAGLVHLPQPGDTIRRWYTVDDGTTKHEFLYSTESIDSVPETETDSGKKGSIASRGFLKYAVDHASSVDEVFSSGESRLADMSERQLVAKHGTWSHNSDQGLMQVTDDKQGRGIATLPEAIHGGFTAIFFSTDHAIDQGPCFLVDTETHHNRYQFVQTATGYDLHHVKDAAVTVVASCPFEAGEEHAWMVVYDSGVLDIYVASNPGSAITPENYLYRGVWLHLMTTSVEAPPEQFYVGWTGKNGSTIRGLFLRRSGVSQTLGDVAESVGARAGLNLTVLDQILENSTWKNTSTPQWYENDYLTGYDIRMEVDTSTNPVNLLLGGPRYNAGNDSVDIGDWTYMLGIQSDRLYLNESTWNGTVYSWTQLSSMPLSTSLSVGDHIRVRIARSEDLSYSLLSVYQNHSLVWSIPMPTHMDGGYLAISGGGRYRNLTVPSLLYSTSVHIWQSGRPAMSEIRSLISPLFWSLWEQPDGSIMVVPTDYTGGNAGSVDSDAHVVNHVPDDNWHSVFRVQGAEVHGVYVDSVLIGRGIRPMEYDTPHLYDEAACVTHAHRRGVHARKRTTQKGVSSFLDPRLDIFDVVEVDGADYVLEQYTVRVNSPRKPKAVIQYQARIK